MEVDLVIAGLLNEDELGSLRTQLAALSGVQESVIELASTQGHTATYIRMEVDVSGTADNERTAAALSARLNALLYTYLDATRQLGFEVLGKPKVTTHTSRIVAPAPEGGDVFSGNFSGLTEQEIILICSASGVALVLLLCLILVIKRERSGRPMFKPLEEEPRAGKRVMRAQSYPREPHMEMSSPDAGSQWQTRV